MPTFIDTVILPSQLPRIAWSNGAGYTRQIAINTPEGSKALPHYRWRLSLADLTQPAAFSLLSGIDRVFTLASDGPITMTSDRGSCALRLGQTIEFEGEAPMTFEGSTGEPQLALNLMTRRGVCTGSMRIMRLNGQMLLDPAAGVVAATVLQGTGALSNGRRLDGLATLVLDAEPVAFQSEGCLVAISTVQKA